MEGTEHDKGGGLMEVMKTQTRAHVNRSLFVAITITSPRKRVVDHHECFLLWILSGIIVNSNVILFVQREKPNARFVQKQPAYGHRRRVSP